MMVWDSERNVALKCDLCSHAPFWSEKGGPGGKQACIELCPMKALAFTGKAPSQSGNEGYDVDLTSANAESGDKLE